MKTKTTLLFLSLLLFFSLIFEAKKALAFTLDTIGTGTVGNVRLSSWSAGTSRPTFRGTTDPSGAVIITIDGTAAQVNADSTGAWVYTPVSALSEGAHTVTITADNVEQQNFQMTVAAGALPGTGAAIPTLIILGLGTTSIVFGKRFLKA